jgi:hypothetical protein
MYVFASSTNQDSKQHGFETSNYFEEDNKKYSKKLKTLKGLEACAHSSKNNS